MGLRSKLAISFLVLLIALVVVVGAIQVDRTADLMVDELDRSGELLAGQIHDRAQFTLDSAGDDGVAALRRDEMLRELLDSFQKHGHGVRYSRIESIDGTLITETPQSNQDTSSLRAQSLEAIPGGSLSWSKVMRLFLIRPETTYEVTRGIKRKNKPFGVIRIGLSTALAAAELQHSVRVVIALAGFAIALGISCAMFLGGRLLRPVVAISSEVDELAGLEGGIFRLKGRDELGTLAEKFNHLSERLNHDRTRWEQERGQLFSVFRSITDAVLLLDSEGSILFANAEATGRLGLPAGGLTDGKSLNLLLGKDNPLSRMIEAVFATGTEVHDVALQFGDRSSDRLLVSIFPVGNAREPAGLLAIVRDLEPVRELESVVDQSGRLAQVGALLTGVAHQVRDPMNAMNLQLELLAEDAEAKRPLAARLETVRREMRRVDEAVYALTRLVRPESIRLEAVPIKDLLEEVGVRIARTVTPVEYDFDPEAKSILADKTLLSEAVRNLATNAVESMPQGGSVTFKTVAMAGGIVEISIIDRGEGIPADQLKRISQLYFTTKSNGTGLGLSFAMRAIDLQKGTINLESQVGKGTTVKIRMLSAVVDPGSYSSKLERLAG